MGIEECSFYEVARRYVEEEGSSGSNTREFDDINEGNYVEVNKDNIEEVCKFVLSIIYMLKAHNIPIASLDHHPCPI